MEPLPGDPDDARDHDADEPQQIVDLRLDGHQALARTDVLDGVEPEREDLVGIGQLCELDVVRIEILL